jgi:AcrR family transcriptional regulator
MNEKFFDLKKEKQDRILNGSLKIFACNGYRHASTDEIVAEAGISKGLLFHYFGSKLGLYGFLYEYAVRYVLVELGAASRGAESDYFRLHRLLLDTELAITRQFPYMLLFLEQAGEETDPDASGAIQPWLGKAEEAADAILAQARGPAFLSEADLACLTRMLVYTRRGMLRRALSSPKPDLDLWREEVLTCILALSHMTL